MSPLKLAAAALLAVSLYSPVSAATVTFDSFTSTNGADKLSPVVTVSEDGSNFAVTVTQEGTLTGSLGLFAFDLTAPVSGFTVSSVMSDSTALSLQSPGCTLNGNNGIGTYCTGTSVPLGGSNNNLNGGLPSFTADVVLAFQKKDDVASLGSMLTFTLSFQNDAVALSDFLQVGLRFQDATNRAGSDKLIGSPNVPAVPLPASVFLLGGAVAGFGAIRRRKNRIV